MAVYMDNLVGDPSGSTNPLTFADGSTTTGTWTSAPALPTIASPNFVRLVVDPNGTPEIVHLTAYTFGATSGTFVRAAESWQNGTQSGAAHAAKAWIVTPTVADFNPSVPGDGFLLMGA